MIRIAELADAILNPSAGSRSGDPAPGRSNAPAGVAQTRGPVSGPASALFASLEAFTSHVQSLAATGGTLSWEDLGAQV